jgi:hypothetical protein
MKKKDLFRIFGTEHPSVEKYREWVIKNNPITLQSWNPPLNSQVKAIILDPELVKVPPELIENSQWDSYPDKWIPIESVALITHYVREAKRENLSSEQLFLCADELKNCLSSCKTELVYGILYDQTIQVLEKHGISVNETISNLKKELLEKKDEMFKNLSEWSTTMGNDTIWKISGSGIHVKREWFENKEEFDSLQVTIVQRKVEEIKQNPQNWRIFKASGINLPWSGNSSYIERKDGKEKFYKEDFNQQQWKEIEKALEKGFFFHFFQSS